MYDGVERSPVAPRGQSMLTTAPWYEDIFSLEFDELARILRTTGWCDGSCIDQEGKVLGGGKKKKTKSGSKRRINFDGSERAMSTSHSESMSDSLEPVSPVRRRSQEELVADNLEQGRRQEKNEMPSQ